MAKYHKINIIFLTNVIVLYMSRTAKTRKFKMRWFQNEERYWAEKLETDIKFAPLMRDEDKNFGGSLILDFRIWWRHVHTLYSGVRWKWPSYEVCIPALYFIWVKLFLHFWKEWIAP